MVFCFRCCCGSHKFEYLHTPERSGAALLPSTNSKLIIFKRVEHADIRRSLALADEIWSSFGAKLNASRLRGNTKAADCLERNSLKSLISVVLLDRQ